MWKPFPTASQVAWGLKASAQRLTNTAWYISKQGDYRVAEEVVGMDVAVEGTRPIRSKTLLKLGVVMLVPRAQSKYKIAEVLN